MAEDQKSTYETLTKAAEVVLAQFHKEFPDLKIDGIVQAKIDEMNKMKDEDYLSTLGEYDYQYQLGRSTYAAEMVIVDINDALNFFRTHLIQQKITSIFNYDTKNIN